MLINSPNGSFEYIIKESSCIFCGPIRVTLMTQEGHFLEPDEAEAIALDTHMELLHTWSARKGCWKRRRRLWLMAHRLSPRTVNAIADIYYWARDLVHRDADQELWLDMETVPDDYE